ncbi:MAG: hydroxymethylglutaryl-CoA reductase, degradative [Deltaproteobacteria bacterium]|nr:hydroxymethylglutaryl-CoA reductase, degradative [Deltaproteobacteria bacterium]
MGGRGRDRSRRSEEGRRVSGSRLPGFFRLGIDERRRIVAELGGVDGATLAAVLDRGGIDIATADRMIENVIGTHGLPLGVATNFLVDGSDVLVPMAIEEPSVVAAASNAARLVREGGGFITDADPPLMIAQVQLVDVPEPALCSERITKAAPELCAIADRAMPTVVARGGGAREVEVRDLGDGMMVVHLVVDCRDAMGANVVNTVAEAVAPRICQIAGARVGLRILSNLADRRRVRVLARVPAAALAHGGRPAREVVLGIAGASRFAEKDPYRAATHNKGIMNGVDAVVIATGNDWRAVEAGAHAHAASSGRYRPLSTWSESENGDLVGSIEMPLALGTVGGAARLHDGAKLVLEILGVRGASELARIACAVGLASNLAALRALATEGIQEGHMPLARRGSS